MGLRDALQAPLYRRWREAFEAEPFPELSRQERVHNARLEADLLQAAMNRHPSSIR